MIVYVACLSGIEFEQVFIIAWLQLFTFSFFGIQISEAGLNLINWFDSAADRTHGQFISLLKDFREYTTLHGVQYVQRDARYKCRR
jgi:hypothetical protein